MAHEDGIEDLCMLFTRYAAVAERTPQPNLLHLHVQPLFEGILHPDIHLQAAGRSSLIRPYQP